MTSQDMSHATVPDPEYVALYRRLRATGGVELREQLHTRYLQLNRGAATPAGLPYPDPTDPVAEGASAIRALAEALDPHVAVRQVYASMAEGFTGTVSVTAFGRVAVAQMSVVGTLAANVTTPVATIPVGYRPTQPAGFASIWSNGEISFGNVTSTGQVNARKPTAGSSTLQSTVVFVLAAAPAAADVLEEAS